MSTRAYLLITAVEGKVYEVLKILRRKLGVAFVDCVEGPPDIVVRMEAEDNQKLADLTIKALTSVENLTDDSQVLPVCNEKLGLQRTRQGRRRDA
jgi:hypothetical protein